MTIGEEGHSIYDLLSHAHLTRLDCAAGRPDASGAHAGHQPCAIMRPMVARCKALEPTLVEARQAPTMAALGATVPQRKDAFQALAAQPLTQAEMVRHTGLTNRTAFGLVQACLEAVEKAV